MNTWNCTRAVTQPAMRGADADVTLGDVSVDTKPNRAKAKDMTSMHIRDDVGHV